MKPSAAVVLRRTLAARPHSGRAWTQLFRHGRACPGHPRLYMHVAAGRVGAAWRFARLPRRDKPKFPCGGQRCSVDGRDTPTAVRFSMLHRLGTPFSSCAGVTRASRRPCNELGVCGHAAGIAGSGLPHRTGAMGTPGPAMTRRADATPEASGSSMASSWRARALRASTGQPWDTPAMTKEGEPGPAATLHPMRHLPVAPIPRALRHLMRASTFHDFCPAVRFAKLAPDRGSGELARWPSSGQDGVTSDLP